MKKNTNLHKAKKAKNDETNKSGGLTACHNYCHTDKN